MIRFVSAAALACAVTLSAFGQQTPLPFKDLSAFRNPPANWRIAGSVFADRHKDLDLTAGGGTGILANIPTGNAHGDLVTAFEHGDIVLDLDYLMPKGSNSGIYLQGRYELQLLDSWGKATPTYGDAAGIYQRWDESRVGHEGYEGHPPRINASRAPGLWQHLHIEFEAPRFDAQGRKIRDARFVKVEHNGVVVHENVYLTGPTRGPAFPQEAASGPILIQGDHGPIAFRNFSYGPIIAPADSTTTLPVAASVPVEPGGEPYVLRSMVQVRGAKRTHAVSVGYPQHVHFSMDLERGEILRVWKGPFVDAAPMWYGRGEDQLAVPLGSAVEVSMPAPIADADSSFYRYVGYRLMEDGSPVFMYSMGDVEVEDRLHPADDGRALEREILLHSDMDTSDLWAVAAEARVIEKLPDGSFAIDDKTYYIETDGHEGAFVDTTGDLHRLLLPVGETSAVRYRIVW